MIYEEINVDLRIDEVIEQDLADYINSLFYTSRFYFDTKKLVKKFGYESVRKYSYYGNIGNNGEFFNIGAWYLQNSGHSFFDNELNHKIEELLDELCESGVIIGDFVPPGSTFDFTGWRISEDRKKIIYYEFRTKFIDMNGCLYWIDYLIRKFLEPNGYVVNGNIVFSKILYTDSIDTGEEKIVKIVRNKILE